MRITIACPQTMMDDANSLAMVMSQGPAEGQTYCTADWRDRDGILYAAASFEVQPDWFTAVKAPLRRPAWDNRTDDSAYVVNMTGAERAQAALVVWGPDMEWEAPTAKPGKLTTIGGLDGSRSLSLMGLERVP